MVKASPSSRGKMLSSRNPRARRDNTLHTLAACGMCARTTADLLPGISQTVCCFEQISAGFVAWNCIVLSLPYCASVVYTVNQTHRVSVSLQRATSFFIPALCVQR